MALLLVGWNVMIENQRYKDSVNTTYSYIQNQYNLVYNVQNGRDDTLKCNNSTVEDSNGIDETERGQSDCILMGRYVFVKGGSNITSYPVVGEEPVTPSVNREDSEVIRSYTPTVVRQDIGVSESNQFVPWGARLMGSGAQRNTAQDVAIMLLRSPVTGVVRTYIVPAPGNDPVIDLTDIDPANEKERTFCVDSASAISSTNMAIVIREFATAANSVETLSAEAAGC
jgi:hypothetical protein